MFDMGFFELLVIALVGLFVIGPERLPHTIRTCALWFGRIKRSILETRREIEQQLGADDIRRELHNEQVLRNWEKMKDVRAELEAKINNLSQFDTGNTLEHDPQSSAAVLNETGAVDSAAASELPVGDSSTHEHHVASDHTASGPAASDPAVSRPSSGDATPSAPAASDSTAARQGAASTGNSAPVSTPPPTAKPPPPRDQAAAGPDTRVAKPAAKNTPTP